MHAQHAFFVCFSRLTQNDVKVTLHLTAKLTIYTNAVCVICQYDTQDDVFVSVFTSAEFVVVSLACFRQYYIQSEVTILVVTRILTLPRQHSSIMYLQQSS